MMRLGALSLVLVLAGCSGDPALEPVDGLVATYSKEARAGALVVRIAKDGRSVLTQGKNGIVSRGGVDWLIREQRVLINPRQYRMEPVAASRSDVIDTLAVQLEERQRRIAAAGGGRQAVTEYRLPDGRRIRFTPPKPLQFKVEEIGTEEVAGRRGKVWRLSAVGELTPFGYEAVMSSDPELAAVGRMVRLHMAPDDVVAFNLEGNARSFAIAMAGLFTKGTLLRLSMRGESGRTLELFRLEKVEAAELRARDFALPGRILDRAALAKPGGALAPVMEDSPSLKI